MSFELQSQFQHFTEAAWPVLQTNKVDKHVFSTTVNSTSLTHSEFALQSLLSRPPNFGHAEALFLSLLKTM